MKPTVFADDIIVHRNKSIETTRINKENSERPKNAKRAQAQGKYAPRRKGNQKTVYEQNENIVKRNR